MLFINEMAKKLLWMDLEMSGLDENQDKILEIAAIITDYDLNEIDEKHFIVFQPQEVLDHMNDWCKDQHGKSGLTKLVPQGTALDLVEKELIPWVEKHCGKKMGKEGAVLAGNSIHADRRFLEKHMPAFAAILHYRMVDVSSFKEIFRERYNIKYEKKGAHRAIGDLRESIGELKHFLSFIKT